MQGSRHIRPSIQYWTPAQGMPCHRYCWAQKAPPEGAGRFLIIHTTRSTQQGPSPIHNLAPLACRVQEGAERAGAALQALHALSGDSPRARQAASMGAHSGAWACLEEPRGQAALGSRHSAASPGGSRSLQGLQEVGERLLLLRAGPLAHQGAQLCCPACRPIR